LDQFCCDVIQHLRLNAVCRQYCFDHEINGLRRFLLRRVTACYNREFMPQFFFAVVVSLRVFFRSRADTALEILALRQQVAVLQRKRPRPRLNAGDRLFWTSLCRFWCRWPEVLLIVKPETVVGWHRAGFRLYWRWRSRARGGRPRINQELQDLIARLAQENPDWGAPKIHAELQKLGFTIAERSVADICAASLVAGTPIKSGWPSCRITAR